MTSKLTREKAQWLHDACEEAADAGIKLTMNPNELLMFTSYALAAMDSEPVGEFYEDGPLNWYQISDGDRVPAHRRIPLYRHAQPEPGCQHQWRHGGANKLQNQKQCIKCGRVELDAQPAPVVPDDFRDAMSDLLAVLDEYPEQLVPINRDSAVVRACRAAMLAAAQQEVK